MGAWWKRARVKKLSLVVAAGALGVLLVAVVASADSLPGSTFEIDDVDGVGANLKVDGTDPPALDWANVPEERKADEPSGSGDDAFGQGTKEDTAVPTVVDGSIPPNKSDLLNFGVYLEDKGPGEQFLNLFWHRVQEPNGTTNMDFEFNKSEEPSGNGVTPVRTAGDLLIQYDLASGGDNPELFLSRWVASGPGSQCEANNSTPCWGTRVNLTGLGDAIGSINEVAIPAAESDGLGDVSPRTFGEAQLDFDALAGGSGCAGFGSAYLKSRSSDSFTSAVKDFIAPEELDFENCGAIEITKTRKHAATPSNDAHEGVDFLIEGGNLPAEGTTVTTDADGKACVDNLELSSTGGDYTVTEMVPGGYQVDDSPGNPQTVVVDQVGACSGTGAETVSFSNTPLTDIEVSVDSQVDGGTSSTITCDSETTTTDPTVPPDGPGGDGSLILEDLEPSTVTCTVVIDP